MRTPDAVIVGAQKAATTGLLETLAQHPRVRVPRATEATVLHHGRARWAEWLAADEPELAATGPGQVVVVKLASGMYFRETLERIRALNPEVRIVVSLRHPVDRILSQYLYAVQHGMESRPVDEALTADEVERSGDNRLRTYSAGSRYAPVVADLDELFGREQVCYLDFGTLRGTGVATVQRFLDLGGEEVRSVRANESRAPRSALLARATTSRTLVTAGRAAVPVRWRRTVRGALQRWNSAAAPPPKPVLDADLRARLLERHAADTDAAEQVLATDLSAWRR